MKFLMKMMMVSCKQAALLSSKSNVTTLSLIQRLKLSMHSKMCGACPDYAKDSRIIDNAIDVLLTQKEQLDISLTREQKERIIKAIG